MNPKLIVGLVVAALAVGAQNYVFFSSMAEAPRAVLENDEEEALWDGNSAGRDTQDLAQVGAPRFVAWLSRQAASARSPFLTGDEAMLLRGDAFAVAAGAPRLSGTLFSDGRRIAWIDGRPHSEGDWVGEHRIDRIEPSRVVLRRGDETLPLTVSKAWASPSSEAATDED